ncbi:STAS domain-containing protein [Kitasatospora sp. P5_F3]
MRERIAPGTALRLVAGPDPALGVGTVAIDGELDQDCAQALGAALRSTLSVCPGGLRLDLGGVTFCDSAALHALIRIRAETLELGRSFTVLTVSRQVDRLLWLTETRRVLVPADVPAAEVPARKR